METQSFPEHDGGTAWAAAVKPGSVWKDALSISCLAVQSLALSREIAFA
jgi:hypothetical protein